MLITHSACNIVFRKGENGPEFLVIDYQSVNPKTNRLTEKEVRFPTGTSTSGEFGESTEETSIRKLLEETGLLALDTERIAKRRSGEDHIKYAFLISYSECLGDLRQEPVTIEGDLMSCPYWVPIKKLRGLIAPKHFWAYRAACERLKKG